MHSPQVVAFIKGTRTQPQCGFSHKVLTILNEAGAPYEVVRTFLGAMPCRRDNAAMLSTCACR